MAHFFQRDGRKRVELEKKIEEMTSEMENHRLSIDDHNKVFYEMKKRKDQLQTERSTLWRNETLVQQNLASSKEELAKSDQVLRSLAGKPILNGRDSVRQVLDMMSQKGGRLSEIANMYYGNVIENFDCDKSIYTAVEVTAGNRMFHHIVESDRVGTEILKIMNQEKLPGEVFIHLVFISQLFT